MTIQIESLAQPHTTKEGYRIYISNWEAKKNKTSINIKIITQWGPELTHDKAKEQHNNYFIWLSERLDSEEIIWSSIFFLKIEWTPEFQVKKRTAFIEENKQIYNNIYTF